MSTWSRIAFVPDVVVVVVSTVDVVVPSASVVSDDAVPSSEPHAPNSAPTASSAAAPVVHLVPMTPSQVVPHVRCRPDGHVGTRTLAHRARVGLAPPGAVPGT